MINLMRDRHFCQNMLTDPELPVPD
jgi:hypothetical protein